MQEKKASALFRNRKISALYSHRNRRDRRLILGGTVARMVFDRNRHKYGG